MTRSFNMVFGWCVAIASSACAAQPVIVTVDMDAAQPGIQRSVRVAPGTSSGAYALWMRKIAHSRSERALTAIRAAGTMLGNRRL